MLQTLSFAFWLYLAFATGGALGFLVCAMIRVGKQADREEGQRSIVIPFHRAHH